MSNTFIHYTENLCVCTTTSQVGQNRARILSILIKYKYSDIAASYYLND